MNWLSPTKLDSYDRCPKACKETKFESNDATKFGDAIHKAIEAYLLGTSDFMTTFIETAKKAGLPALGEETKNKAKACFASLNGSSRLEINPDNIISIEASGIPEDKSVVFSFPEGAKKFFRIPIIDGWGLQGSMDFVDVLEDGTLRIIDWKTGLSTPDDDFQLACYALAAWKIFPGFSKIQTGFFFLEQEGKYEYSTWDETTLVAAFNVIKKACESYVREVSWKPKINKYCGYCPIKDDCALYLQTLKTPVKVSEWSPAIELKNLPLIIEKHSQISALKKTVDAAEKYLNEARKTILKEYGSQVIGDREYHLNEYPSSYDYDLAKLFSRVEEVTGKPPFEIMKLDSAAYDALITEQEDETVKKALKKIKKECGAVKNYAAKVTERIAKEPKPIEEPLTETKTLACVRQICVCQKCGKINEEHDFILSGGPNCAFCKESVETMLKFSNKDEAITAANSILSNLHPETQTKKELAPRWECPNCKKSVQSFQKPSMCPFCEKKFSVPEDAPENVSADALKDVAADPAQAPEKAPMILICLTCASLYRVEKIPASCERCNTPADMAFVKAQNETHAGEILANIQKRIQQRQMDTDAILLKLDQKIEKLEQTRA